MGTLGASRYGNIIDELTRAIKASGKRSYIFLVGKPNVPKLANFSEIDVFVLVACPESSVVDSKEFLQPIVTPFELDVALNKNRKWDGSFTANFRDLLDGGSVFKKFEAATDSEDMSLISGKIRSSGANDEESEENNGYALTQVDTRVGLLHVGGGGEVLAGRSWQGLEQKIGETSVEKAKEGTKGIAWQYDQEGQ